MRATDNTRGIEMNRMKESSSKLQKLAENLKERHDFMKEWYDSRNTTIVDGVKKIIESSEIVRKRAVHPIGEILEEGEIVSNLSHKQLLALNAIKDVNDAEIEKMPIEPEAENAENIEEIVFEGETSKTICVRADGIEFDPFDEEWMKENQEDIDEQLKNRTSSDNPTDSFEEWRKGLSSRVEKPMPPHGKILSWVFVKEIYCVAIKREYALTKLELVNRSNFEGATLFERKIKFNKRT
ncbi:hypothetical protein Hanom_Chr13g01195041 [Helianthus anomalus]